MESEQILEFSVVRKMAYEMLRFGTPFDLRRMVPLCQFLILPSFENPIKWDVIKVHSKQDADHARLFRVCWRSDLDSQAFRTPVERLKHPRPYQPTIETHWVPIDQDRLDAILARLRAIRIPLMPATSRVGLDGTRYELAMGDLFCSARIGWWCDLPKEWQELQSVVAHLLALFETTWKQDQNRQR